MLQSYAIRPARPARSKQKMQRTLHCVHENVNFAVIRCHSIHSIEKYLFSLKKEFIKKKRFGNFAVCIQTTLY